MVRSSCAVVRCLVHHCHDLWEGRRSGAPPQLTTRRSFAAWSTEALTVDVAILWWG